MSFFGGLAEGMESGQGLAQRSRALGLQEQQFAQQAEAQRQQMDLTLKKYLGESADAIIDKNVGEIDKLLGIAEKAVGDGKFAEAQKLVAPLQSMYDRVMRVATPLGKGNRVIDFRPRFEAILATTLTPMEQGGKQGMVNLGQQATENAGGLPAMKGAAEGVQAVAAQPGKSAAEVANIGATAAPKANAAALSTAATTGAQIAAEANNLPAVQAIAGAKSAGQTAGKASAEAANVDIIAAVEQRVAAAREAARSSAGASDKAFTNANTLRDEFNNLTKDFRLVQDAYQRILSVGPTPAGDMALIFGYMKMLDPGSTVREGEYATARNAAGIPERVRAMFNKAVDGESLTPDMRADFKSQAEGAFRAAKRGYDTIRTDYEERAKRANLDVRDVLPKFEMPTSAPGKKEIPPGGLYSPDSIIELTVDGKKKRARVNADGINATILND